ncbi:hypothetical protein [Weissella confusa]|nr:hypothetical protein [Weissella confusa]
MGSRLMHAAIAKLLMTKFDQLDMGFLIGNEAPDDQGRNALFVA